MRTIGFVVAFVCAFAGSASAAPLDPKLQPDLLALYKHYGDLLQAGKLDAALALRTANARQQAKVQMRTAKQRQDALAMARALQPDSVEVVRSRMNAAGTRATLVTLTSARMSPNAPRLPDGPEPGYIVHGGLTLVFEREAGAWRLADLIYGDDPSQRLACPDERYEPVSAYDADRATAVGGPINRVDFQVDHTLLVVSVVGEASCVFLPSQARLVTLGIEVEKLVPFAIVTVRGLPHRTDKQKVLAESLEILAETD